MTGFRAPRAGARETSGLASVRTARHSEATVAARSPKRQPRRSMPKSRRPRRLATNPVADTASRPSASGCSRNRRTRPSARSTRSSVGSIRCQRAASPLRCSVLSARRRAIRCAALSGAMAEGAAGAAKLSGAGSITARPRSRNACQRSRAMSCRSSAIVASNGRGPMRTSRRSHSRQPVPAAR